MGGVKMKKSFVALTTALVLLLTACGGGSSSGNTSAPVAASSAQATEAQGSADAAANGYTFSPNGASDSLKIAVDTPMEEVLPALGEANSYFEAPSCAFDGVDKTYTYPNFVIDTYPVDGVDLVSRVFLSNDLVETSEGLAIGQTKQNMIDIYGSDYEENGTECIYTNGNMKLRVIVEEDRVKTITYTSIAAESEF